MLTPVSCLVVGMSLLLAQPPMGQAKDTIKVTTTDTYRDCVISVDPLLLTIKNTSGFSAKIQLYISPGQNPTELELLAGQGIIFKGRIVRVKTNASTAADLTVSLFDD